MKLLGLIPARGGSKRLPGKNIRMLGGRPLIAWALDGAHKSGVLADIIVSTDDKKIADIAKKCGGWVPWLRPSTLASDTSSSVDVALHALDWYEDQYGAVDGLMLLQPTSPFRRAETIREALRLFENCNGQSVVSLSPVSEHPAWTFRIRDGVLEPFHNWEGMSKRSQDLDPAYTLNGAIYLVAPEKLRQTLSLYTENTVPLVMKDPIEALDIDTVWDWELAEAFLSSLSVDNL